MKNCYEREWQKNRKINYTSAGRGKRKKWSCRTELKEKQRLLRYASGLALNQMNILSAAILKWPTKSRCYWYRWIYTRLREDLDLLKKGFVSDKVKQPTTTKKQANNQMKPPQTCRFAYKCQNSWIWKFCECLQKSQYFYKMYHKLVHVIHWLFLEKSYSWASKLVFRILCN